MLNTRRGGAGACRQRGVGLIELLVAIVIATLGLLSLAGMQVFAARHAHQGQVRATATHLAQDLGERMRANPAVSHYAYTRTFEEQQGSYAPDPQSPPSPRCTATTDTCTAVQMADADLFDWRLDVRDLLPHGSVFVRPDTAGSASGVDLWIAWVEPRGRARASERGETECPVDLRVSADSTVRCHYVRIRP